MLDLARTGLGEGIWLRAERQSAGRGRQGRPWTSPPGNFAGSTLVRLRASDPPAASLALVAGLAAEACVAHCYEQAGDPAHQRPQLKWPNDLLIGGAKLAGILLERVDEAVVVGIGVNLAHYPDLSDRPTTSLSTHGIAIEPAPFAEMLAEAFARWLARWRAEGLGPIRERWLARAHPVGTALTVHTADGMAIEGLFAGLDSDGALLLRLASGERRVIHAADVFLL